MKKDDFEKLLEDETTEAEEVKVEKTPPLTTSLGDLLADWKKKQEKKES